MDPIQQSNGREGLSELPDQLLKLKALKKPLPMLDEHSLPQEAKLLSIWGEYISKTNAGGKAPRVLSDQIVEALNRQKAVLTSSNTMVQKIQFAAQFGSRPHYTLKEIDGSRLTFEAQFGNWTFDLSEIEDVKILLPDWIQCHKQANEQVNSWGTPSMDSIGVFTLCLVKYRAFRRNSINEETGKYCKEKIDQLLKLTGFINSLFVVDKIVDGELKEPMDLHTLIDRKIFAVNSLNEWFKKDPLKFNDESKDMFEFVKEELKKEWKLDRLPPVIVAILDGWYGMLIEFNFQLQFEQQKNQAQMSAHDESDDELFNTQVDALSFINAQVDTLTECLTAYFRSLLHEEIFNLDAHTKSIAPEIRKDASGAKLATLAGAAINGFDIATLLAVKEDKTNYYGTVLSKMSGLYENVCLEVGDSNDGYSGNKEIYDGLKSLKFLNQYNKETKILIGLIDEFKDKV